MKIVFQRERKCGGLELVVGRMDGVWLDMMLALVGVGGPIIL